MLYDSRVLVILIHILHFNGGELCGVTAQKPAPIVCIVAMRQNALDFFL